MFNDFLVSGLSRRDGMDGEIDMILIRTKE